MCLCIYIYIYIHIPTYIHTYIDELSALRNMRMRVLKHVTSCYARRVQVSQHRCERIRMLNVNVSVGIPLRMHEVNACRYAGM